MTRRAQSPGMSGRPKSRLGCGAPIQIGTDGDGQLAEFDYDRRGRRRLHRCPGTPEPPDRPSGWKARPLPASALPKGRVRGTTPEPPRLDAGIEVRDGVVMVDGVRFSAWLRARRSERGLSQPAVTRIVGCSHARIGQLEIEWKGPAQQITPLIRRIVRLFREE